MSNQNKNQKRKPSHEDIVKGEANPTQHGVKKPYVPADIRALGVFGDKITNEIREFYRS